MAAVAETQAAMARMDETAAKKRFEFIKSVAARLPIRDESERENLAHEAFMGTVALSDEQPALLADAAYGDMLNALDKKIRRDNNIGKFTEASIKQQRGKIYRATNTKTDPWKLLTIEKQAVEHQSWQYERATTAVLANRRGRFDNDYGLARYASQAECVGTEDLAAGDETVVNAIPVYDQEIDLELDLKTALSKLSERDQAIITAYHYEEKTDREIATVLGISKSTVCEARLVAEKKLQVFLDK